MTANDCKSGRVKGVGARRGFTWLEIIVISSIAVILVVYLFPAFTQARESSKRSTCQSNLKWLAQAFQSYAQDNDHALPPVAGDADAGTAEFGWAGAIGRYLPHRYYLQCPADWRRQSRHTDGTDYTTYFFNSRLDGIAMHLVKLPAHTILDGDHAPGDAANNSDGATEPGAGPSPSPAATRHLLGANYAFCDGHVAWLKPNEVKTTAPSECGSTFGY